MRRACGAAAIAVAAACNPLPPAHAIEMWSNATGRYTVGDDASACFELYLTGPFAGVASAVAVVRTETRSPTVQVDALRVSPPTEHVTDVRTFSTQHDSMVVCVGGTGRTVRSGWAVFTVTAHSDSSDAIIVLRCEYTARGPACR